MNNFYTAFIFVMFCGILNAQENGNSEVDTKAQPSTAHPGLTSDNFYERATPFYTEDFGGGFPTGWAVIDSSGICPWRYSTDGSWGYWSQTGETSGDAPINSTTGANGFLISDPDSANHVNYGQPSGTTYQYLSTYVGTSAIDCSTHGSVILTFEHNYRYNNSVPMFVMVSTDSSSWTAFDVSNGIANNTESPDPAIATINLSGIAANQSTVYLRFGWSARVYYWMLDDINLSEADPFDVSLISGFWGTGLSQSQYFKIPTSQWSPITFYGGIENLTGNTINDAYFDVDVNNGGSVFSGTSNLMNLAPTQADTALTTTDWTPTAVGNYDITFDAFVTGQTDGNLSNNNMTSAIEMTNSVYALDNLPSDLSGSTGGFSNWSGNSGMSFGAGNYYEVIADGEIECIQIGITSDANNEAEIIYGAVYEFDGSSWNWLGQTSDYSIQSGDLGDLISLVFDSPIPVTAGAELAVVACHYGGNDAEFMTAQSVPQGMVLGFDDGGSWYSLISPNAVVVRADFDCYSVGLEELSSDASIKCYPNPANDLVNVELILDEASAVEVNVFDINGKLVYTKSRIELTEGLHVLPLNTEKYEAGTYTVEVNINDNKTRRLIVVE